MMNQGSRLLRKRQESSVCLLLPSCQETPLGGLFRAVCLLTTCSANRTLVGTPGSSCSVSRKAGVWFAK